MTASLPIRGLILFAHGSRAPETAEYYARRAEALAGRRPDVRFGHAFLEGSPPTLADTVGRLAGDGIGRIDVVPLFLAPGRHVLGDLPRLIDEVARAFPEVRLKLWPLPSEHPLFDAILLAPLDEDDAARDQTDS